MRDKTLIESEGTSATHSVSTLKRTLFNAGCRSTQTIFLNILSVPATAYIIRKLGATGYGEWSTAVALIATVGVLTNLGLRGKFVRAVAQDADSAPRLLAEQLGTRLALALLAGVTILLSTAALRYSPVVIECAAFACVGLVISTAFTGISDMFEAFQRFPAVAFASLIGGIGVTLASVIAVAFGGGPVMLSMAYLVGPIVTLTVLYGTLIRERFPVGASFHPVRALKLLWMSRHFAAQQLLGAANSNVAVLMLPRLIGQEQFGFFAAGVLLVTRLAIFPDALGTAFYPMIASMHGRDMANARRQTLRGCLFAIAACTFVALCTTMVAGVIATILLPKAPALCERVIVLTIWALPLIGIESMLNYALNALGRESAQARAALWAAIVNVSTGVVLVLFFGLTGACVYMLLRPAIQIGFVIKANSCLLFPGLLIVYQKFPLTPNLLPNALPTRACAPRERYQC